MLIAVTCGVVACGTEPVQPTEKGSILEGRSTGESGGLETITSEGKALEEQTDDAAETTGDTNENRNPPDTVIPPETTPGIEQQLPQESIHPPEPRVQPEKRPVPERRMPPPERATPPPERRVVPDKPPVTGGSPGCGKKPPVVGVKEDVKLKVMGKTRTFVLSVPAKYNAKLPHPVIFGFPGLNATGKGARGYLRLERTPGPPIIYIYPTAVNPKKGWQMRVGGGDVEFFDAMLSYLEKNFCVNSKRVYSTGFSHGAMFTNNLTCVRIKKLRGIAPIGGSGPWYGKSCLNGALPAMVIHGNKDGIVKYPSGQKTRDHWKTQNQCGNTTKKATPSPCVSYNGCKQPLLWCPFTGGHQVPSFAGTGVRSFFMSLK